MLDENIPHKLNERTEVEGEEIDEIVPNTPNAENNSTNDNSSDSGSRKTNPKKIIGLIVAALLIGSLCCCCCAVIFLPRSFVSEQTIQDLCAILKTEGVEETYGFCD